MVVTDEGVCGDDLPSEAGVCSAEGGGEKEVRGRVRAKVMSGSRKSWGYQGSKEERIRSSEK